MNTVLKISLALLHFLVTLGITFATVTLNPWWCLLFPVWYYIFGLDTGTTDDFTVTTDSNPYKHTIRITDVIRNERPEIKMRSPRKTKKTK